MQFIQETVNVCCMCINYSLRNIVGKHAGKIPKQHTKQCKAAQHINHNDAFFLLYGKWISQLVVNLIFNLAESEFQFQLNLALIHPNFFVLNFLHYII